MMTPKDKIKKVVKDLTGAMVDNASKMLEEDMVAVYLEGYERGFQFGRAKGIVEGRRKEREIRSK